jgi:hypothetical protein
MKKLIGLVALVTLVIVVALIVQSGAEERAVRRIIDEVKTAALDGLNFRDSNALGEYSAVGRRDESQYTRIRSGEQPDSCLEPARSKRPGSWVLAGRSPGCAC